MTTADRIAALTMPDLVREGLAYFEKTGDAGDRVYVDAIRHYIADLERAPPPYDLAHTIAAKLPTIRARTGNLVFDAGTNEACDKIAALLPIEEAPYAHR